MARITDTVKILLIVNVIFWLGSQFILGVDPAMKLFALWFIEHPNFQYWQPLTHMFMHDLSSPMHLIFNMYALWMFGSPIENALGQKRFVFFYFSAGLGAALIHTLVNYYHFDVARDAIIGLGFSNEDITNILSTRQYSTKIPAETVQILFDSFAVPAVGASGAIYGVLVAFGMLFPNAALGLLFIPIPIKAKFFIPALILLDLFSGLTGFSIFGANIANWAHLGGALFGFIMMWYWKKNGLGQNRWN